MTRSARGATLPRKAVPRATPTRVVAAVLFVGLLPWSVQSFTGGGFVLRFLWGAVGFDPRLSVSLLSDYPLFAGPPLLLQWASAVLFWTLALLSAGIGFLDAEDPRVTAGLLALAGVTNLLVALEFGVQPERTAYPVGTLAAWAVAGWRYRAARS
ncbi:TIGR04206 family protein [Halorarum salinum]|uniref:TIGR04206 family protein n=1 Tax=Halorarum salinum TaxID=2743089 RepID=A0A7D5L8C6_9EURY|nr:TIGR04206 family protein [Halobaculum salinum]QLG60533.1 TIGR04206 family protein [Halobaculum salinum]